MSRDRRRVVLICEVCFVVITHRNSAALLPAVAGKKLLIEFYRIIERLPVSLSLAFPNPGLCLPETLDRPEAGRTVVVKWVASSLDGRSFIQNAPIEWVYRSRARQSYLSLRLRPSIG